MHPATALASLNVIIQTRAQLFPISKSYDVLEVRVSIKYAWSGIEFSLDLDQLGSWADDHNRDMDRAVFSE